LTRGHRLYGRVRENVTVKLKKREKGSIQIGVAENLARTGFPDRIICVTALFLAAFLQRLLTGRGLRSSFPGTKYQEGSGDGCC